MNALEVVNQAKDAITVRRVYGEPYQQDGVTIIPAANVMGGGGGGGDTTGNGGVGFGMAARPAGAWDVQGRQGPRGPGPQPKPVSFEGPNPAILAPLTR